MQAINYLCVLQLLYIKKHHKSREEVKEMQIVQILVALLAGYLVGYLIENQKLRQEKEKNTRLKRTSKRKDYLIERLSKNNQENENYNKIKEIYRKEKKIVDRDDKVKELIANDN